MRNSEFQLAFGNREMWHLEGDRSRRYISAEAQALFYSMSRADSHLRMCPFCRTPAQVCGIPEADHELYCLGESDLIGFGLELCPRCAWWRFWSGNYQCMDEPLYAVAASVAARFHQDLPDGYASELARALRQRPHLWHHATPTRLEKFVAEIFRANCSPCEVRHVGGTGDGGVDVLLISALGTRIPIQVKRRAGLTKREPISTIREFLGALLLRDARIGVVVSTATGFTAPALNAVAAARDRGFLIELADRSVLDDLLGPLIPHRPWRRLFEHPELKVAVPLLDPIVEASFLPGQLRLRL